jgi:hypothetical protein
MFLLTIRVDRRERLHVFLHRIHDLISSGFELIESMRIEGIYVGKCQEFVYRLLVRDCLFIVVFMIH